jgi:hypothetical protein
MLQSYKNNTQYNYQQLRILVGHLQRAFWSLKPEPIKKRNKIILHTTSGRENKIYLPLEMMLPSF